MNSGKWFSPTQAANHLGCRTKEVIETILLLQEKGDYRFYHDNIKNWKIPEKELTYLKKIIDEVNSNGFISDDN